MRSFQVEHSSEELLGLSMPFKLFIQKSQTIQGVGVFQYGEVPQGGVDLQSLLVVLLGVGEASGRAENRGQVHQAAGNVGVVIRFILAIPGQLTVPD